MNICITKRKDGRYMGRFIIGYSGKGKAKYQYVYGRSYWEAEEKVRIGMEIETRYLSGRNITVYSVYTQWLNAVNNRIKESTYSNYKTKFEKHILPEFGNLSCCKLTVEKINNFVNKKLAEGLSASYVRDIFTVFKSMLKYAQEEYDFKLPLKNVVLPKCRRKKAKMISDTDQRAIVEYLKANMEPTGLCILISLFMGLRIGEICGLKWSDVDFDNKVLYINRTIQRICSENGDRKTKIIISTPKSETSIRTVAIPDFLMKYFGLLRSSNDRYILSDTDKLVEPRTLQYRYKKILLAAKAEQHNFHKLRHKFATNCIQNGFDIKTLSSILGHSSVSMTLNRYIHPDRSHERRLMNSMQIMF